MIFQPLFAAILVAATVFLQYDSAWWKGLSGAAALFALAFGIGFVVPLDPNQGGLNAPIWSIPGTLFLLSFLIGLAVVFSLAARRFMAQKNATAIGFFGTWFLLTVIPFLL